MRHRIENEIKDDEAVDLGHVQLMRFPSVGILDSAPGDIEYRYLVMCNGGYRHTQKLLCEPSPAVEIHAG
jgi:hypothetical protein